MDGTSTVIHVEVARNPSSSLKRVELEDIVRTAVAECDNADDLDKNFKLENHAKLKEHVKSITFCSSSSSAWYSNDEIINDHKPKKICSSAEAENGNGHAQSQNLQVHVFDLNQDGENTEFMDDDEEDGQSPSSHHWILPSNTFHDLWDSLVFETEVKTRLMDYVHTAMLYSDKNVNESLISWNKVILLHGPPGTGKTSLCKALAHKATIRLSSRFRYGQLIEINSHSLFSKWFSESGKLVMRMFEKIQELIDDPQSVVFLLIDEVESLAQCRQSAELGNEPSDSIRAVNALLTQIDRIKKYPNVMILTTSNVAGSIDLAFVDRADLKIFVGNPPAEIIYSILASSINELIRVGIITSPTDNARSIFLPEKIQNFNDSNHPHHSTTVQKLKDIANLSVNLSGRTLRKIPFLTHVNFIRKGQCNLDGFLEGMAKAVQIEKEEVLAVKSKHK